jgi:hypothetical protein
MRVKTIEEKEKKNYKPGIDDDTFDLFAKKKCKKNTKSQSKCKDKGIFLWRVVYT